MKVSLITELPQRFRRLFRTTTPKSSNVGRPGFEQRENWQRFFDKYRAPCIEFVEHKYPFCKPDSEDVFMRLHLRQRIHFHRVKSFHHFRHLHLAKYQNLFFFHQ